MDSKTKPIWWDDQMESKFKNIWSEDHDGLLKEEIRNKIIHDVRFLNTWGMMVFILFIINLTIKN